MATFRVCCGSSERRSVPGTSGCAVAASASVLRGKGLRISSDRDLCPTLSNLGCNLLNLLDSAISSVSISPIISKGVLNVGSATPTDHGPDLEWVTASHTDGRAGWWKSPCPDLARGRGG